MSFDALRSSDSEHRVVRFRPRRANADGSAKWHRPNHDRGQNISPVEGLAKYERGDLEDDYRHRMVMNGLALVVTIGLIASGVWLAANIDDGGPPTSHAMTFTDAFN